MIDRRTIALINGEVDGLNTPEESEILRQTLAQDPEAQKLLEDLKKLERNLSSLSLVDPPAGLKKSIMRSLQERRIPTGIHARKSSLSDFLFPVRSLPRLGFAFGGGVLAGIALVILYFAVASHPSVDARDASGTLFGASSESLQTAEDAAISGDGVDGRVVTEYSGTVSVMRVNLTMKPDVIARFTFNPDGAKLKGVSLAGEFPGTLTQRVGLLEVGHGGGTFRAFFAPGVPPAQNVRFQVVSAGNVLYERSFPLGRVE